VTEGRWKWSPKATTVTTGLLVALALQNAVPPFATDMYAPSFPAITIDLSTSSGLIGLTLTTFFIGMGFGQLLGGAFSDQMGRRRTIIAGGLVCTLGAVGCVLAPSISVLIVARMVQGFGGGIAAATSRAVLVDLAVGSKLASAMSLMMAIGGVAPMVAPVIGGMIATVSTWRVVFWSLVAFGLVMTAVAFWMIPESLPPERRHRGGLRATVTGMGQIVRRPAFVGYLLVSSFSSVAMFAYIADSSYVFQGIAGLSPMMFSLSFALNAFVQMGAAFLNARLVIRFEPRKLLRFGLAMAAVSIILLGVSVFALGTPLWLTGAGFTFLMASQGFIFGNSSALALSHARDSAGIASAVLGLIQSLANSIAAPLASLGGSHTAVPMIIVMLVGSAIAWSAYLLARRADSHQHREAPPDPNETDTTDGPD